MKQNIRTAGLVLGIMALAGVAVGQSTPTADIRGERTPSFDANQIVFKPGAGRVGLALSVSGPGSYQFQKEYEPGVHPTFSVRDLEDGLYGFELRTVPALKPDDAGSARAKRSGLSQNERGLKEITRQSHDTIVESGHFRVEAGHLVLRNIVERGAEEPPFDLELTGQTGLPEKDVCHADDLIVDGSLCVGFDCVCNQGFGFDTIIIKENNLRIFFDDTSTTASFPKNDWRIIANDTSNGGASYFGIQDATAGRTNMSIEAGAPANSLYVEDTGDVGFGTSTPVVDLHVVRGDTPTLRLDQDGSSGFTSQTWDVAGNETNFFIRDVTHGSQLPFRIRPDAPTSSIFIDVDGDIGLGTSSPDAKLHLVDDAAVQFDLENTATSETWRMVNSGAAGSSTFIITNLTHAGAELTVQQDGDLLVQGTISSGGTPLNVPDYVFEAGYELPSIAELAAFVVEYKHLPNVPSADELKANGLNHSEFQMRLLEKVEELTLYTLQQQNTIDELLNRLEELEKSSESRR